MKVSRRGDRIASSEEFEYTLAKMNQDNLQKVASKGTAVDMSDSGMGFLTDYPVERGDIVKIIMPDRPPKPFMVRWVQSLPDQFRAGGLFL